MALVLLVLLGRLGADDTTTTSSQPTDEKQAAGESEAPQPSPDDGDKEVPSISGRGSDALTINLTKGLGTFTYSFTNESPNPTYFSMDMLDSEGRSVGLIANGTDTTSESKAPRIPHDGTYTINVSADRGSWTLTGPS